MKLSKIPSIFCVFSLLFSAACTDDLKTEGPIGNILKNDCIKRTLGTNIVGNDIEFVYAMALPRDKGKILSASVEASIAGAAETYLEHRSAHANSSGQDVWVVIGDPCTNTGGKTDVSFSTDTCAAALRYFYRIPEEARGQQVSFTFTASASNGETVSYKMGPYTIGQVYTKLDLTVTDGDRCYISIADMAVYNEAEAAANPEKIDLVYLYREMNVSVNGTTYNEFGHAFVSPASETQYLPGVTLPAGVNNNTPLRKVYGLRDKHLSRLQWLVFVDDLDMQTIDLTNMPNYATRMLNEAGMWVETQDGAHRAYIYVNSINNTAGSAVISMKRLPMK